MCWDWARGMRFGFRDEVAESDAAIQPFDEIVDKFFTVEVVKYLMICAFI